MKHEDVQQWLDGYVEAWRSNDPAAIGALFTEDATYSFRPWKDEKHTVRGRSAIVASWVDSADSPETWDAHYEPYVVEANKAVAVGWSRYDDAEGGESSKLYHNAYLLEFDGEQRCQSYVEFYMLEK